MKPRRRIAVFVLFGFLANLPATGGQMIITNTGVQPIMRSALPPDAVILDVQLCFSKSGRSICAWWWPKKSGYYEKDPVDFAVMDLAGHLLGTSSSTNHQQLIDDFPTVAWREHLGEFVKESVGWTFASDFSKGLRIQPTGVAEMWELREGQNLLWKTALPQGTVSPSAIGLLRDHKDSPIFIADGGERITELDPDTGKIRRSFTPGPIEARAEAVKRKKRFHLQAGDDGDPSLYFSAFAMAYEPKAGLLACGAFFDKRVRVIEASSPSRMIFEANADVNPALPKGGRWTVQRVEFLGRGKYMLAEYHFGGRGTRITLGPTEIFDTSTWALLWQQDNVAVRAVTLSPDGTMLALLRSSVVEIYPFTPGGTGSQN